MDLVNSSLLLSNNARGIVDYSINNYTMQVFLDPTRCQQLN